jgi:hypothetical protein
MKIGGVRLTGIIIHVRNSTNFLTSFYYVGFGYIDWVHMEVGINLVTRGDVYP